MGLIVLEQLVNHDITKYIEWTNILQSLRNIPRVQTKVVQSNQNKVIEWAEERRRVKGFRRNEILVRTTEVKKGTWILDQQKIIGKLSSINKKEIRIYYWEIIDDDKAESRYQKHKKAIECTKEKWNINQKKVTKKRIYIPRLKRNQDLIDQEIMNKPEKKTLSRIINNIDKIKDRKAKFWIKISSNSKENTREIRFKWVLKNSNIKLRHKSSTWSSRLK
ncbi:7103_t:CDS:2 [Gigaspora margarita]|uniref:7103_t:CDS:1 n=1 Tax=Gigaspora margarita TaxID=4874 RepID=A0ABN7UQX6_GIGMA|nr:7103_t:CDS:2 [Gigaspora margarita]